MKISDLIYEKITSLPSMRNNIITKDIFCQLASFMGAEKAHDYMSWLSKNGKKDVYDKNKIPLRVGDILKCKIEKGYVDILNRDSKFCFMQVGGFISGSFMEVYGFKVFHLPVPVSLETWEFYGKMGHTEYCDDAVRESYEIVYMAISLGRENI